MNYLTEGFIEALHLIFSFNREIMEISFLSLKVATISTIFSSMAGLSLGFLIATHNFWGKKAVLTVFNTLMALPAVVVGLLCYSFLARKGPLGSLGLLYTQEAMIIGQFILATPIITSLSISALSSLDPRVSREAFSLGATSYQRALTLLSEGRFALTSAIIAGFGRVFAEVGISMMLGGNIKGYTRNITTTIALETSKGEFALGLALGMILLTVAFGLNILFHYFQARK